MAGGEGNGAVRDDLVGDDEPPHDHGADAPEGDELRQLIAVLRRNWHWIALITAVCTAVAAVRTLRLEPVFAATARLKLDRELPDPTAAKYVTYGDWIQAEYLNTQIRIMESVSLSAAAVEANPRIKNALAGDAAGGDGRAPSTEGLAWAFRAGLSITPVKDTYLVDITYQSTMQERCADFANALAQAYIDERESQAGQRTRLAVEKIGEQADLLREKLERSERELRAFLEQNQVPLIERNEEIIVARIGANHQALTGAQQRRIKLDAELEAIQRVIELGRPLESAPAISQSAIVSTLRERLAHGELEVASLSERYGDGWPEVVLARARRDQLKLLLRQEIETVRARLHGERDAVTAEEQGLLQRARQLHEEARELAQRARLYETLRAEVEANRRFYEEFATRLKEAASYSNTVLSNVRFVDRASGWARVGPNHSRNVGLGVLFGLALAAGVVLLRERLGDRIRTVGEATRVLRLPVIGVVPEVTEVPADQLDLYAMSRSHSVFAEAFRRLRVQIDAIGGLPDDGCGVLLSSSGVPQEGKTLCAINIAIAAAQGGKRTLLIDGDMRGPRVHRAFELPVSPGLAEVLKSKALWGTVIQQSSVPNLSIMTAGKADQNPAEVLSRTSAFQDLLARLRPHFDRIIIDTAPAAAVTDATLMAPFADATVLVVSARASSRSASRLACTELMRVGAAPRGLVFNHQSASDADYYYGTYYRRYAWTEPEAHPPPPPPVSQGSPASQGPPVGG
ncbi:MAG: polysaccharide biosynthesis tyrosine autokinase [Planctomycetes bacterium]|nr:polysaccharide biosynthesis tyrosine autokinase [Planctomycetota bacterium]